MAVHWTPNGAKAKQIELQEHGGLLPEKATTARGKRRAINGKTKSTKVSNLEMRRADYDKNIKGKSGYKRPGSNKK